MQSRRQAPIQLKPATSLDVVYKTLQPAPLQTPAELQAFYSEEINKVRGGDKMERIQRRLDRAANDGIPFKACVMGHRGVGKSTELSRLIQQVKHQFVAIRIEALSDLDPGSFRPLDIVLLMMVQVAEQTAKPIDEDGAGQPPSDQRLREIWDWFATEKEIREQSQLANLTVEAGAGVKENSLWNQVLGLFANLKGDIKFASTRKTEVVEYRLTRLSSLLEIANRLLDDCNGLLLKATGKQWLFIGEDFDRAGIPDERITELFVTYANIFQALRTHLIFNLPIGLYYSAAASRLPFAQDCSFVIPDTPVYRADHQLNSKGCLAVDDVLKSRMDLRLFESASVRLQAIVASGGNLRDLFALVNYAADNALGRGASQINAADMNDSVTNLRSDYQRRLGQSPYDKEAITYSQKADLLSRIYNGDAEAQMTDPVMYSLLNSRAVQEFVNGSRWFGLHPLVVDLLVGQKRLEPQEGEAGVRGGTQYIPKS
jgi:hypothetical protein